MMVDDDGFHHNLFITILQSNSFIGDTINWLPSLSSAANIFIVVMCVFTPTRQQLMLALKLIFFVQDVKTWC